VARPGWPWQFYVSLHHCCASHSANRPLMARMQWQLLLACSSCTVARAAAAATGLTLNEYIPAVHGCEQKA